MKFFRKVCSRFKYIRLLMVII